MTGLLIGADIGGTATRVAVAQADGTVLAAAEGPAGNPNAVGLQVSAERVRATVEAALLRAGIGGPERSRVQSIVLGMGGYGTARAAGDAFARSAVDPALGVRPRIVSDLAAAFASATPLRHGLVIIAGTGAGAAEIDTGEIVARRGAWGWLLGDEGSGFWLGREALRWTVARVERGESPGPLATAVLDHLGAAGLTDLLRIPYEQQPYADTPVRLADLAVLVGELADADPAAARIAERAGQLLADQVIDLLPADPGPADRLPIVTGGSVLARAVSVRRAFVERLGAETDAVPLRAASGLAGALWISAVTAAGGADPAAAPPAALHGRLRSTLEHAVQDLPGTGGTASDPPVSGPRSGR